MSWPTVVGISGPARSGKDTAADFFSALKYARYSFAGPLKQGLRAMLGLSLDHTDGNLKECELEPFGVSPRRMMQNLGTEWGRELIHDDIWLLRADKVITEWRAEDPNLRGVVISDVRFENEANWCREQGGLLVHLQRPDAATVLAHASEAGVEVKPSDHVVQNDGSIDELHRKLSNILRLHVNDERHPGQVPR